MPLTQKGIVVRLPGETHARVETLARSRGRSLNFIMNEAVQRYLAEEAWIIDEISEAVHLAPLCGQLAGIEIG